jgi:hypothetical protein
MTTLKKIRQATLVFLLAAFMHTPVQAQQLLGAITGTVKDASGAVVAQADVKLHNKATNLELTTTTASGGFYNFFDLPIGTYVLTFTKSGFQVAEYSEVLVLANRTTTVSPSLKVGTANTTVEVKESNLLNQVDTTNGFVLGNEIIQNPPLGTGSFTQLAILSPGVNADLLGGSGINAGLGNQAIWANGQRDTSNSFSVNGISSNNLFNGKSTSQVGANRVVLNTGERFNADGSIGTATSVYDAIGQALPTPAPETLDELRVNTSMYDASQGANSGAHIELLTKSGTNAWHGQAYEYFQNGFWNASPFFYNQNRLLGLLPPGSPSVPDLHRNTFGATLGGPIKLNKLFFFVSYQGVRATDKLNATSSDAVPPGLTSDRSASTLANVANQDFGGNLTAGQIDPVALKLLNTKLPNGSLLIPSATGPLSSTGVNVVLQGPSSTFTVNQFNTNLDYNINNKDRLAGKYYFQTDPSTTPFGGGGDNATSTLGFPQNLRAGSQLFSLNNTINLNPNMVWEQRIGFTRQIAFAETGQPFGPSQVNISLPTQRFPGILIDNVDNNFDIFNIGTSSNFANAGVFQNQYELGTNFTWVHGRHTFTFGTNWDHNRVNVINHNSQVASLDFANFPDFLTGTLRTGFGHTTLFSGTSNRHYRANQTGAYAQDNFKLTHNLNLSFGVRFDDDGPLTEINGLLTNFHPDRYQYDLATDTIVNDGLVFAGNNKQFHTPGVSDSTLTGRQWGFAPRVGIAWSPAFAKNLVVRAGAGIYYDRGEFFSEFSPSAGGGFNGPFGVTLQPPFIVPVTANSSSTFANPFGNVPVPPQDLGSVAALFPNQAQLEAGTSPFLFGGYDPRNKLPYSESWTLDLQWQPYNALVLTLGYVGNHGVHGTMPIPFNQAQIATPQNPVNGQIHSYGFQATDANGNPLVTEPFNTSTGGNVDLRVPFIGYSPNSVLYEAVGVSNYNALQVGVNKRLTHGLQISGSYTWSHTLDEQSGLGLFFNGNNPLNLRSAYASSDFDRTHVLTLHYLYEFPKFFKESALSGKFLNGWGFSGITVAQSGQPFSVIDFSGAVGGIFYSSNDFLTNPIVPLAPGASVSSAKAHGNPALGIPSLNPAAFAIQFLQPGQDGVPPCGPSTAGATVCDTGETPFGTTGRNIFRGPFQTRFDFSLLKQTKLNERFSLKYTADFFNIFNHPSFDTPNNNVSFFPGFSPSTFTGTPSGHLGVIQHSIGSPRFIQMSLHLLF